MKIPLCVSIVFTKTFYFAFLKQPIHYHIKTKSFKFENKGGTHPCHGSELECQNEGRCEIKHGVPHCICQEGYKGRHCQFFYESNSSRSIDISSKFFFIFKQHILVRL